jgi:hypothetical protein
MIACSVKAQTMGMTERADALLVGLDIFHALFENPEPCDPPDLSPDGRVFCGLPLIVTGLVDPSRLALVFDVPLLRREKKGEPAVDETALLSGQICGMLSRLDEGEAKQLIARDGFNYGPQLEILLRAKRELREGVQTEATLPAFTVSDPETGLKEVHESVEQRVSRGLSAKFREAIRQALEEADRNTALHIERDVYHEGTARAVMQEVRDALSRKDDELGAILKGGTTCEPV